jgi:hypothetical protein
MVNLEDFCKQYSLRDYIEVKFLEKILKSNLLERKDLNSRIHAIKLISLLIVFEINWGMLIEYTSTIVSFLSRPEIFSVLSGKRNRARKEFIGSELLVMINTYRYTYIDYYSLSIQRIIPVPSGVQ